MISPDDPCSYLSEQERADLRMAKQLVETIPIAIRISSMFGDVIEKGIGHLPNEVRKSIANISETALSLALDGALLTLDKDLVGESAANWQTKVATFITGLVGGIGGLPSTIAELPVTTALIMRSISQIAREQGENLRDAETQRACIEVFAMGGPSKRDDGAETGYWGVRLAFANGAGQITKEAAKFASKNFGVVVTQKSAAQAAPVIGALIGGAVNLMFTDFYQDVARGHFIIRRLVRQHGENMIKGCYASLQPAAPEPFSR